MEKDKEAAGHAPVNPQPSTLDLSPGDQTLTAPADTPLLEIYRALPDGLYPPFPPVELPGGLGGLVARGGFGQNFFFGAEVLGVTFRAPSGRVVRAGGRTVKNVQGYDLTRPFVGSFGVLGQALEVTLRLRPGLAAGHLRGPGRLDDFDLADSPARFVWEVGGFVHLLHFGHPAEVERALAPLASRPGTQEGQPEDLRALFPGGIGPHGTEPGREDSGRQASGGGVAARDRRFGWVDGEARPEVPALFARMAARL